MLLKSGCTTEDDQYSSVVIEQMRQRQASSRPGMQCGPGIFSCNLSLTCIGHEMDVRDLKFEEGAFDVVIDKGSCP